jgi:DNA-binding MarR family transcriptional regulator
MSPRSLPDRLHSLAIHLLRHVRTEDAAAGMSAARLSVLSVLVFGGASTVTRLAAAEQVATPTMTRLLQGLEADGYVRRRQGVGDDGRVVRVTATAKGRRALDAARQRRIRKLESVTASLTPAERGAVEGAVSVLERALSAAPRGGARQ